jgi:CheY-like chemotaxis protein
LPSDTASFPLSGLTVLVAEDDIDLQEVMRDMLEDLGAETLGPVRSAREIAGIVGTRKPDAVTLDVNLGGRLAYDSATWLQQAGIPIVFVTGYTVLPKCPDSLKDVPCLKKPFNMGGLAAALLSAIGNAEPA